MSAVLKPTSIGNIINESCPEFTSYNFNMPVVTHYDAPTGGEATDKESLAKGQLYDQLRSMVENGDAQVSNYLHREVGAMCQVINFDGPSGPIVYVGYEKLAKDDPFVNSDLPDHIPNMSNFFPENVEPNSLTLIIDQGRLGDVDLSKLDQEGQTKDLNALKEAKPRSLVFIWSEDSPKIMKGIAFRATQALFLLTKTSVSQALVEKPDEMSKVTAQIFS
jgi:hypothetical protein